MLNIHCSKNSIISEEIIESQINYSDRDINYNSDKVLLENNNDTEYEFIYHSEETIILKSIINNLTIEKSKLFLQLQIIESYNKDYLEYINDLKESILNMNNKYNDLLINYKKYKKENKLLLKRDKEFAIELQDIYCRYDDMKEKYERSIDQIEKYKQKIKEYEKTNMKNNKQINILQNQNKELITQNQEFKKNMNILQNSKFK